MRRILDGQRPRLPYRMARAMQRLTRHKTLRAISLLLVIGVCTLAFALTALRICTSAFDHHPAGTGDFVEYWASGHQLAQRADPYDANAILILERSAGYNSGPSALVMGNAPTALPLLLPLGFLGAKAGWLLWFFLLLASLAASVRMIWTLHDHPPSRRNFLGYSFAPALLCLMAGQASLLVLLGLTLFLRLHRSHPFLAGASLWLCLLKPHLFLPFGVVLLLWAIFTRCYKLLAGTATALAVSAAIVSILDPLVWAQYAHTMSAARYDKLPIPCLSILLRRAVSPGATWLQYLPAALGCLWALTYFRRHRVHWDWGEHGSPLMLVSLLVAPYSWLVDQSILVPALLHGVYLTRCRGLLAALALAGAVIEIAAFSGIPPLLSGFYLWTAPTWLAWYLYAVHTARLRDETAPSASVQGGPAAAAGACLPG